MAAERDEPRLAAARGDMRKSAIFADASFAIVFHPISH
jgi:hypothetical protein